MVMEARKSSPLLSTNSSSVSTIVTSTSSTACDCQQTPPFNPQSLGREFVRQYYTLLNEGPHILYRFYSDDSTLLHGGSNVSGEAASPVYGQEEIYRKIMSLNFKDCHTKIRQVDSLETVGKGVVIQVIGELSNNCEPMRRFFQTFVLAPRSPTNYYVRTDIFRYQDEIFGDEEEYSESERVEDINDKIENQVTARFNSASEEVENTVNTNIGQESSSFESINVNGGINGVPEIERVAENETEPAVIEKTKVESPVNNSNTDEGYNEEEDRLVNDSAGSHGSEENTEANNEENCGNQNEPKTYANMVSKNPTGNGVFNPPPFSNTSSNYVAKPIDGTNTVLNAPFLKNKGSESSPTSTTNVVTNTTSLNYQANNLNNSGKPPITNAHSREQRGGRPRGNQTIKSKNEAREVTPSRALGDGDSSPGDVSVGDFVARRQQFADDQQVFVGNLLQDITEDQLRTFFTKFGNIIDVRINRANQKQGKTPNYGFVTFDDPSIVRKILSQKPIYFNGNRFNVEEKRSQSNRGSGINSNRNTGGVQGSGTRVINNTGNSSNQRSQSGGGGGGGVPTTGNSGQRSGRNDRVNERWNDRVNDRWGDRGGGSESGRRSGCAGERGGNRNSSNYQRR